MQVHILSVNGGDVEAVLGAFKSIEGCMAEIKEHGDQCGFSNGEGYVATELMQSTDEDNENAQHVFVHEDGQDHEDWVLVFTVRTVELKD